MEKSKKNLFFRLVRFVFLQVDKTRPNEYGMAYEDTPEAKAEKAEKERKEALEGKAPPAATGADTDGSMPPVSSKEGEYAKLSGATKSKEALAKGLRNRGTK